MEFNVYVTGSVANPSLANAILSKPPFYLKFIRVLEKSGKFGVEGSLDASVFKGKSPAAMPLNDLRGFVKSMYMERIHNQFSIADYATPGRQTKGKISSVSKMGLRCKDMSL
jgi:hypothetical protein